MKRIILAITLVFGWLLSNAQSPPNEYLFIKFDERSRHLKVYHTDRVDMTDLNKQNGKDWDADLRYVLTVIEKLETEGWTLMDGDVFHQVGGGYEDRAYFWSMRKPKQ